MLPSERVDLDLPPAERWAHVARHADGARRLVTSYVRDLGGAEPFDGLLEDFRDAYVDPRYVAEIDAVAGILGEPASKVLLANLYYDSMKAVLMGCTAFAVDADRPADGHARVDGIARRARAALIHARRGARRSSGRRYDDVVRSGPGSRGSGDDAQGAGWMRPFATSALPSA